MAQTTSPTAATTSTERVYTLTNAAEGNAVAVFTRQGDGTLIPLPPPPFPGTLPPGVPGPPLDPDGVLRPLPPFATGGLGAGGPLISQGLLTFSDDRQFLFAASAGSNEVSSFLVTTSGLQFVNKVPSGGVLPVSVTSFGNLVYVVNAVNNLVGTVGLDGPGTGQIAGFTIGLNGILTPLEGSNRVLNSATSAPAQISFNADGTLLVVTEFLANRITVFQVEEDGRPGNVVENPSVGRRPFGFSFNSRGHLIVSEFGSGGSNDSSVSSYEVNQNGTISVISKSVPTDQNAACWIVNTPDARYSYASNTLSGSISGYRVNEHGELTPLDVDGRTAVTGDNSLPIDMVISADGRFLSVLAQAAQTIATFIVGSNGCLTPLASVGNIPPVAVGLVTG